MKLRAEENSYGKEVDNSIIVYAAIGGGAFLFLAFVMLIARKNRKREKQRRINNMAKFCGNCGTQLEDNAKICGQCGTPLDGTSSKILDLKVVDPEKYEEDE